MNNLNSCLMYGKLFSIVDEGEDYLCFTMLTYRHASGNDESLLMRVATTTPISETVREVFDPGRLVRVVGRIGMFRTELSLIADHVDIKPLWEES